MRFVRQIIADRMSGGVLALLLSFMMMLDGTIGAHALGAMTAAENIAAAQIICSTDTSHSVGHDAHDAHGAHDGDTTQPVHHKHGSTVDHSDCCSAACQFAAQVAATDLPAVLALQWQRRPGNASAASRAVPLALQPAGLFKDARGPPRISI